MGIEFPQALILLCVYFYFAVLAIRNIVFHLFAFSFLLLAQKKRNKEKGAFSDEFFRLQGRKTVYETPRRYVPSLLFSELSPTILRIRIFASH